MPHTVCLRRQQVALFSLSQLFLLFYSLAELDPPKLAVLERSGIQVKPWPQLQLDV